VVPVALPLLGAAALMAVQHFLPRRVGMWTAIAIVGIAAVACGLLLDASWFHPIQYWMGGWAPRNGFALGIEFAIDPMGACTATLVAVLGIAALVFSEKYFDTVGMLYPALMLIFIGAMCGFSLTGDLFNLFVFFELMSVSAFALCAYKTEDPGTVEGAWNFAVVNSVGAFLIMIGIAFIYARTSALNMAQIGAILRGNAPDALVVAAFTFIAGGLMIKAAQVPFHFWLADAHSVAPTPVCVLFSGVMVELALYGIARVYWTMFSGAMTPRPGLRATLIVFAGATALLGAFMSFTQRNLKRMLAFSTISHSGMIALGIALLSVKGLAGAAIYTLGHGATKGSLFLAAGIILHRLGDLDEFELHGKGRPLWMAALILVIGAAGLSGIPPSGTHRGDVLIRDAARDLDLRWLEVFSVTSSVLTAAAVFRYVGRVFFGWGSSQPLAGPPPTPEASETKGAHNRTPPCDVGSGTASCAGRSFAWSHPEPDRADRRGCGQVRSRTGIATAESARLPRRTTRILHPGGVHRRCPAGDLQRASAPRPCVGGTRSRPSAALTQRARRRLYGLAHAWHRRAWRRVAGRISRFPLRTRRASGGLGSVIV
jgi:multicomponent Na+:H+ antiporter subunit D